VISHLTDAIDHAQEDVMLASPYFVPGKAALEGLTRVRKRGVPVTLVTNTMASNDEPFVSAAYGRYRRQMLQAGMRIYEVSPRILHMDTMFDDSFGAMLGTSTGRLHAKMVVVDLHTTIVGSMNLDFRSSRANTELGLFVESGELAADVSLLVDDLRSQGTYRMRLGGASGRDVQWVDDQPDGEKVYEAEPEIGISTLLEVWLFGPFIKEDLL
jgi:putative cardiolipin synthase